MFSVTPLVWYQGTFEAKKGSKEKSLFSPCVLPAWLSTSYEQDPTVCHNTYWRISCKIYNTEYDNMNHDTGWSKVNDISFGACSPGNGYLL